MPPALSAEEIRDVNTRYHDVAAGHYDAKWGIDFGDVGCEQVLVKLDKAVGHRPDGWARSLEIGAGTGYFTLNLLRAGLINEATCTDTCAAMWPPATVIGTPTGGGGIDASKLGTVARENGTQITYAGHPLYLSAKDLDSRDRYGEGAFRVWWLVGPDGQEITASATHTTVKPAPKAGY